MSSKTFFALLSGTALGLGLGATAMAGTYSEPIVEPQVIVTPPPPSFNWSGGYAGIGLGYVRGDHQWEDTSGGWQDWTDSSGGVVSGLLGYNWHGASNFVFGAELLVQGGSVDGSESLQRGTITSEIGTTVALRARLGYAMDRSLVFLTLGGVNSEIEYGVTTVGGASSNWDERVSGGTVGIGFERALDSGWNIRGDLEHYRYSDTNYENSTSGVLGEMRTRANVARVSLVRRF